jgi:signal transduction histidine kinase
MTETKWDFKISSGLKNIIGKELITNDRIAIFELIKNSYDANAKKVVVVFQNIKNPGKTNPSKILIIDDGDGMSEIDLEEKWLFVGYSDKKYFEQELKENYRHKIKNKRFFAGAKGVGRFSCDRLGSKLKIYTKKEGDSRIHHLEVDWKKFEEDQKKEFKTIKVQYSVLNEVDIENYPIKGFKNGTILEISSLNDKWDKVKLLDLKKYLQRLINPSLGEEEQEFKIDLEASEYLEDDKKVRKNEGFNLVNSPVKNVVFEKLDIKTTHIKSSISDGKIKTELIDKGKFIFRLEEKNEYADLDNINVNLFYLGQSAKTSFTKLMGVEPKNYGSVFLYKNKFRIHPYGDEGDDWLGLEKRKAQGYSRYLANRELMGRVELHGPQPCFNEVSSRAGGVNVTEAYKYLQDYFIEKILRRLEKYVVEGIDWDKEEIEKQKTPEQVKRDSLELIQKLAGQIKDPEKNIQFSPDLLTVLKDKQIENLPQVIKNVESLKKYVKVPEERNYIEKQLKSVKLATKNLELEKVEKEKELKLQKKESLFLGKVASADKDIIINLNHTIENSTQTIKEIIIDINKKIQANSPISEVVPFVDELSIENEKIKVLAGIVSMANFNTKVELIKADIVIYIKEYLEKIIKADILKFKFSNDKIEHITHFRPLEIAIVLDNFISNAKKAGASSIAIKFKTVNKHLQIQIADDGKGIEAKIVKNIFNRGFTMTKGSGIGLHHIKTIVENMRGSVGFLGNDIKDLEKGACFEVMLP